MKIRLIQLLYGVLIAAAVMLMYPRSSYNDPDTFWHIEVGRSMIAQGQIPHHAIHTFYGDSLPYIPHEFGFQLLIAPLYQSFGWPGVYLLTAVCLLLLVLGLLRLGRISRKELGLQEEHPLLLPFVLLITCWIYYCYFKGRPQMISAVMIVWFFVYLREFQLNLRTAYAAAMIALSCAVANFHAGVWPVIFVFTGMAFLESLMDKKLNWRRISVFVLVGIAGLLNPGGIKSLMFIFTVTRKNFNMLINEWQPIQFGALNNLPILLLLLFFAVTLPYSLQRRPFRFFLMLGILYLGVSSLKQNLFMWLFIPYFAAVFFETVPSFRKFTLPLVQKRTLLLGLALGLIYNTAYIFIVPPVIDAYIYPVEEMTYILDRPSDGNRPKVLVRYGSSGYVMFRGGDVLCDGRQDPFVTHESVGAMGWTAFERSMYGFSEYLPVIVRSDHPQYVIVQNSTSARLYKDWVKEFGQPVFKGSYGSVFSF